MRSLLCVVVFGLSLVSSTLQAQPNLVLYKSSSGDYIGGGATYVTTNTSEFAISGDTSTFTVSAFGFDAYFQGPGGANMTVGVYMNAARWPFNGSDPGLSVFGNGRGCNTVCGIFEIKELSTTVSGQIDRLWVTFTHVCECFFPPLDGEIRYRSLLAPPAPLARTLRVPADFPTIQLALDNASPLALDTVQVSPGVYVESIQYKGKRASVVSLGGPAVTQIRPPSGSSAATFNGGETAEAVLSGFTVTNAATGVSVSGSTPTILSNVFVNCGTGIDVYFASPTIRGNRILNGSGDGIHLQGAASPLVDGNLIQSNSAGISMFAAGSPVIRNNRIQGNRSDGLNMVNQSDADIIQNLIIGNGGSGIDWLVPSGTRGPFVVNNTILKNILSGISADGYDAGSAIINNIISGSPALSVGGFNDINPPQIRHNDIYSPTGTAYSGLITNMTGIAGNISADALFACVPGDDYHLLPGSACVDAGTNGVAQLPDADFDAQTRIRDGNFDGLSRVDMGAYELDASNPLTPCLYITCPSNLVVVAMAGQNSSIANYAAPVATAVATVSCAPPSGSVFPGGTTTVTCTASLGGNSTNCTFTVTVLVSPIILTQPQNLNVPAGQSINLSVGATGTAPLTYRWTFEGANLAGATSSILVIANAQSSHEGIYRVVVQNNIGSVTSSIARVRVLPAAPTITAHPASISVGASSNVTFSVEAVGSLPLAFRWSFNGSPIVGPTGSSYSLNNAQASDAGMYQVIVTNASGAATSAGAVLTVIPVSPYFATQPRGTSVVAGGIVALSSLARGSEPISYQWQRDGIELPGARQSSLVRSNMTIADGGAYMVVASNVVGVTTSQVAQVTIFQTPAFQQSLSNQVVDAGSTVRLSVQASAIPAPGYSWQWNGVTLPNTNASLTLSNIQPSQSGYYRVTAANPFGSVASVARVSVLGPISTAMAWGDNSGLQTNVPAGLDDLVAVSGGDFHSLALRHDGSLVAWGYNGDGQAVVPTNALGAVAIASGAGHNLALLENGTVIAWGRNDFGQRNVSAAATSVLAIAAGESHSSALLSSGSIVNWGDNFFGQVTGSAGFTGCRAIAAGRSHGLALRNNGTVAAWGFNVYGQASAPPTLTDAAAVAAGYLHSLALRSNGTVVAWGDNSYGQLNIPAGLSNVTAIACGDFHSFALRSNGTFVAWGDNSFGQANFPNTLTSVVSVSAGYYHGLALTPVDPRLSVSRTAGGMVITWVGPGILQSAPGVRGPFTDIPGLWRSHTNLNLSEPSMFFRLRR